MKNEKVWNIAEFRIPRSGFIIVLRKLVVAVNSRKLHHTNINVGKSFNQKAGKWARPGQKHFLGNAEGLAALNAARLCGKFTLLERGSEHVPAPRVCCGVCFGVSSYTGVRRGWRSRCFEICILSVTSLLWSSSSSSSGEGEQLELSWLNYWHVWVPNQYVSTWVSCLVFYLCLNLHF